MAEPTRARKVAEGKTKVVVADDHTIVRSGLRMVLEAEPDTPRSGSSSF